MKRTPEDWRVVEGTLVMAGIRLVANCDGQTDGEHPTACRLENMANARAIAALPRLAGLLSDTYEFLPAEMEESDPLLVRMRAALKELEGDDV